ncbi:zinc finger, CCHC-type containing protein, partial [Tanacetum coccineum]
YAKVTIPHLRKLDDRSIPMIYLGVEEGSKAYRLYDPIAKKKHVSRDVKFMEIKPWDWDRDEEDTSTQDTFWTSFVIEGVDNENTTPVNIEINDNIDNPYQEQDPINDPNSPITPSPYTYNPHSEEEATTSSTKNSGNRFDDTPVRGFKNLNEIYENAREVEAGDLLLMEEEPRNYKEASTDEKWIEAMEIELDSINKNNTWTLTTLPPDQKAIGLKWASHERIIVGRSIFSSPLGNGVDYCRGFYQSLRPTGISLSIDMSNAQQAETGQSVIEEQALEIGS